MYTILIVMVVYIHSTYLEAKAFKTADFIQEFFGSGIFSVANCLFFSISGYLFAKGISNISDVWNKQKKRFRTLILPYLLWNLIFILWYVLLEFTPGVNQFNNSNGMILKMFSQPLPDILFDLFAKPAAFQLWFLRDLICMLLFTPILWWIAKKSWLVAFILAIASVSVYPWLIYFWCGVIIGANNWDLQNYPKNRVLIFSSCVIFLGHAAVRAVYKTDIPYLNMLINVVGLYVVWSLYDIFSKGKCAADKGLWKFLCGFSFFIYCFHEPAFNIIKKLTLQVFGISEPTLIIFYFINPWIMIFMAVLIARLLAKYTPAVYRVLTGGR